jgi:hypothetical protein
MLYDRNISITPPSFMKFCPVVPEICRGQVHGPRKERKKENNLKFYQQLTGEERRVLFIYGRNNQ